MTAENWKVIHCPIDEAEAQLNQLDGPWALVSQALALDLSPPMFCAVFVKARPQVGIPLAVPLNFDPRNRR